MRACLERLDEHCGGACTTRRAAPKRDGVPLASVVAKRVSLRPPRQASSRASGRATGSGSVEIAASRFDLPTPPSPTSADGTRPERDAAGRAEAGDPYFSQAEGRERLRMAFGDRSSRCESYRLPEPARRGGSAATRDVAARPRARALPVWTNASKPGWSGVSLPIPVAAPPRLVGARHCLRGHASGLARSCTAVNHGRRQDPSFKAWIGGDRRRRGTDPGGRASG